MKPEDKTKRERLRGENTKGIGQTVFANKLDGGHRAIRVEDLLSLHYQLASDGPEELKAESVHHLAVQLRTDRQLTKRPYPQNRSPQKTPSSPAPQARADGSAVPEAVAARRPLAEQPCRASKG
jgi:hypothetical protein